MWDTAEQQIPPGESCLRRLASQRRQGSQVPSSELPQVAKDVFASHSEQAVLYSSAEILADTLACLMFPF